MACTGGLIRADITGANCGEEYVPGFESSSKFVIINYNDVDTFTASNGVITAFQLKSGTTGYDFESVKKLATGAYELVKDEARSDGYTHTIEATMTNPTAANLNQIDTTKNDSLFLVVVKNDWKGGTDNAEAFTVYGLQRGMVLTTFSKAGDGSPIFSFASQETKLEGSQPQSLLLTDFDTTNTAFEASFAQA